MTNTERDWTPASHMDAVIRQREYATYDEEWDAEHVEQLVDDVITALAERTGVSPKHFRRHGLAELARARMASARGEKEVVQS